MKLYFDEHIDPDIERFLGKEFDVYHASEHGRGESDNYHLQKASELGCHIVTRDDDFLRLISEREEHPGVVFITDFKSVKEIGLEIKERIQQIQENTIVYI